MKNKPLSTATRLAAKAQAMFSKSESKQEEKLLDERVDLDEKLQPIQRSIGAIASQKGSECRQLSSGETRVLVTPSVSGDVFPRPHKTVQELEQAVHILERLQHQLLEHRGRFLSEKQHQQEALAQPVRQELADVQTKLQTVQSQLSNS